MATNPLSTKQRYLPTLIKVVCSNIVPVISKTRCHQERRNRFLPAFGRKSLKEKRASLLALAEITVNLSKVDKKMNFQYGCSALICLFGTLLRPTFLMLSNCSLVILKELSWMQEIIEDRRPFGRLADMDKKMLSNYFWIIMKELS